MQVIPTELLLIFVITSIYNIFVNLLSLPSTGCMLLFVIYTKSFFLYFHLLCNKIWRCVVWVFVQKAFTLYNFVQFSRYPFVSFKARTLHYTFVVFIQGMHTLHEREIVKLTPFNNFLM